MVGYQLDWSQFPQGQGDTHGTSATRKGRREDMVYILPGAVMQTRDMARGMKVKEEDVGFKRGDG